MEGRPTRPPDGELLTLHRKGGFWVQFGGHLEPGDRTLAAGALREAREESGLVDLELVDLEPVNLELVSGDSARHGAHPLAKLSPVGLHRHALSAAFGRCREHLDIAYVALAAGDAHPLVSDESDDVAWWPIDALPATAAPDVPARLAELRAVLAPA